jgi:hypothetical protein
MSNHALSRTALASAVAIALVAALAAAPEVDARDVKGQARGNVNAGANRNVDRNANVNKRTDVDVNKRTNVNVDRRTNVNIDRDRDIDIDVDVDHDWDDHHNPVLTGMAIGATAAITSAVIGSIVYTLPPACSTVVVNGIAYSQCGTVWYQPQYVGTSVQYVVVNPVR